MLFRQETWCCYYAFCEDRKAQEGQNKNKEQRIKSVIAPAVEQQERRRRTRKKQCCTVSRVESHTKKNEQRHAYIYIYIYIALGAC